jgi:hypothetical protein
VTDNGTSNLDDEKSFSVSVASPQAISSVSVSGGVVSLTWNAVVGTMCRLQQTTNLTEIGSTDVPNDVKAMEATATKVDDTGRAAKRFQRIRGLP